MIGPELEMLAGKRPIPDAMQTVGCRVLYSPRRLFGEYEKDRHGSELGRLFKLATNMHKKVDRVVVLGIGGSYMGARALMEGCCQPYWNELSRGDRGSRPRLYFEGNNVDNDATQGLLHLLGADKKQVASGEADRWGWWSSARAENTRNGRCFSAVPGCIRSELRWRRESSQRTIGPGYRFGGKLHKMVTELDARKSSLFPTASEDAFLSFQP